MRAPADDDPAWLGSEANLALLGEFVAGRAPGTPVRWASPHSTLPDLSRIPLALGCHRPILSSNQASKLPGAVQPAAWLKVGLLAEGTIRHLLSSAVSADRTRIPTTGLRSSRSACEQNWTSTRQGLEHAGRQS